MNTLIRISLTCLLLAGCQRAGTDAQRPAPRATSDATSIDASNETVGLPAGWRLIAGQAMPRVPAGPQHLPARVISDEGVETQVRDTSRTIAGGDDVILVMEALGLGAQVYAAPLRSSTQSGQRAPQQFLFNRNTGVEGVLSLEATFFLGNSVRRHAQSGLAAKLRAAGLPVVVVDDLQPIAEKIRKTSAALGRTESGLRLAEDVQAQLDEAARIAASLARQPRVIHVSASGAGGAPTVGGRDNAASGLIRLAGGINVGDEAGVSNYSELSREGVLAAAPEVILVSADDLARFGGPDGLWRAYPSLKLTPAGRANRVWVMPDVQLKAASVASGAGAIALATALTEVAVLPAGT